MEIHIKMIGWILFVLSIVHVIFPRYFKWKIDMQNISRINREMMYVHTFFIALAVLLMGLLCITSAKAIISTPLGNKLALGFFIFWFMRLVIQFAGYSPALWRGKRFETAMHILFSILWTYFSVVFFMVFWNGFTVN